MSDDPTYKIIFQAQGKVYEIYDRSVSQSSMFGFIEVEEILFGERSQVVVDPSEETLKNEFKDVRRTFLPMHSVVRIDQVARQGQARITQAETGDEGTLMPLPAPGVDASEKGPGNS